MSLKDKNVVVFEFDTVVLKRINNNIRQVVTLADERDIFERRKCERHSSFT